ncbi:MAG TPA: serine/threonine-protein kinase, partial [Planctomycetota bacterium]|nr:serine/threonine-protein kinase [Planctomycetota bacterium]
MPDAIRLDLLATIYADRAAGRDFDLTAYCTRFPGLAPLLRQEHERVLALASAGPVQQIGPYRLLREIARGGQGVVFEAEDPQLGRRIALKVLQPGATLRPGALARFAREAALSARLCDPGLCPIHATGSDRDHWWIAMRLLPGPTLAQALALRREQRELPTPASTRAAVAMAVQLLRTLHRLHQAGIVHRDLKPSNVSFDETGLPVVLDLGLATALDAAQDVTRSGDTLGTPAYMAPEQVRGQAVDRRADLHAIGVLLHEAITLAHPLVEHGTDPAQLARAALFQAILTRAPASPSRCAPDAGADGDLDAVLATAMAKEPQGRYATAAAFADDLQRWLAGAPVRARRTGALGQLRRWARREPLAATGLFAALFVLTAGLAVTTVLLLRLHRQQTLTQTALLQTRAMALRAEAGRIQAIDPTLALLLAERAHALEPGADSLSLLYATWSHHPDRIALPAAGGALSQCEFAGDRRSLLLGADDGTLRLWRLGDNSVLLLPAGPGPITAAALSATGTRVAAAAGNVLSVWDGHGALQRRLPLPATVMAAAFRTDDELLVGSVDGSVQLLADALPPRTIMRGDTPVFRVMPVPGRDLLLVLTQRRQAHLLRSDGTQLQQWAVPGDLPPHAVCTADGRLLATFAQRDGPSGEPAASDHAVRIHDC